jgi:HK97 family phage portal protein
MSLRDALRALLGPNPLYRDVTYVDSATSSVLSMSAEQLWRTQPHLRTVVSFVARNIAQLGLQTFERVSETDRRRVRDDAVALTLARPNATMTAHELVYGLVADFKLYDVALWLISENPDVVSGWEIHPIPPAWVISTEGGTAWAPAKVNVQRPGSVGVTPIDAADLLIFHGWNPGEPAGWSSPVDALRGVLAEQIYAMAYRSQVWQKGGRVGTVLERPANSPVWSPEAREKFSRDWRSKWAGNMGPKAGGTPILEDGMSLKRIGFSAHEDEWIEGVKLSLSTVAEVYHINPTMVGVLDNANFSNIREFRRMLYGDSLGPDLAMIEDRINTFLVPRLSERPGTYVEFNIAEKMQGSFEEQAAVFSTAVGRPWMTADEARSRNNMPAIGGDAAALVTPLNVLVGGQASPRDSGSQNRNAGLSPSTAVGVPVSVKARAPQTYEAKAMEVLSKFFRHQRAAVLSALGAKAGEDWWDEDRWDGELSDDLYALAVSTAKQVSAETLDALGFDPAVYDEARTLKFLRAVSDSRAGMVNATTRDQIKAALAADPADYADGEAPTPAHVFDVAESSRIPAAAVLLVTAFSAFATHEAASQAAGDRATKTWITGPSPRPEHAVMDGETVPLSENFSNGQAWPGDASGGSADDAGCNCALEISVS